MQVVRIDKKGRALVLVVVVIKNEDDGVIWVALGNGGPWTVVFDKPGANPAGSPFTPISFDVKKGDFEESGPLKAGIANGTYKYNVKDPNKPPPNNITDDPDVDVE
jgi:hypothetical protein